MSLIISDVRCAACGLHVATSDSLTLLKHTCPGSGFPVAFGAHDAGAVAPVVELPLVDVFLNFTVRGTEDDAAVIVEQLAQILLEHADVTQPLTFATKERP